MSIFSPTFRYFSSRRKLKGFTLIELIVVSAIILVISSFIIFNQAKFNSSTLLRSLAYNIALSVRQAQVYGTSVFGVQSGGQIVHAPAYGVSFFSGDSTHYVLFSDLTPGDRSYAAASAHAIKTFALGKGYTITKFCATTPTSVQYCSTDSTNSLTYLTIYFKRPSPDAYFETNRAGEQYASAYVQVRSSNGDTRSVTVTSVGQISVTLPNTNP